jgi:cell division protein FtsB
VLVLSVILVGALLVVLAAIVVDSPLGRSWARRLEGPAPTDKAELQDLQRKVDALEGEVHELREGLQFVNKLLEDPRRKNP